jgi:putative FmdB family regulatory protein
LPTYQYLCNACDHAFEEFQSFSEEPLTECPECKGEVRKVYSSVGVVFKGSGFYKTDSVAKPAAVMWGFIPSNFFLTLTIFLLVFAWVTFILSCYWKHITHA